MRSREQRKNEIVLALLERRISPKLAIAQLMDIGWEADEAKAYVDDLIEGDSECDPI